MIKVAYKNTTVEKHYELKTPQHIRNK